METTREEYRAKMEGRLEEWGRWIEDLGKKLEKAGAAAKKDLAADLSELKDLERSTLAPPTGAWAPPSAARRPER